VITRSAYGAAADVWSLGCVAWELLCGAPPLAHVLPVRALFMIPEVILLRFTNNFLKDTLSNAFEFRFLIISREVAFKVQ